MIWMIVTLSDVSAGGRGDDGRGDYQERAAADSADETESQSSVWSCVL